MRQSGGLSLAASLMAATHLFSQSENANRSTWPTKRNRATSLWKPPNIIILSHLKTSVNLRIFQTFPLSFMEHPILKNPIPGCIMKIQKRSESNVLSKLPQNKSIESKRLRKWVIPSSTDDPWSCETKDQGSFLCGQCPLTMRSGRPVVKSHHWVSLDSFRFSLHFV